MYKKNSINAYLNAYHDKLIEETKDRLLSKDRHNNLETIINTEIEYQYKGLHSEIDLFLRDINGDYMFVFEMKCHNTQNNRKKAKHQLLSHYSYVNGLYEPKKVYSFYCHYKTSKHKELVVKRIKLNS